MTEILHHNQRLSGPPQQGEWQSLILVKTSPVAIALMSQPTLRLWCWMETHFGWSKFFQLMFENIKLLFLNFFWNCSLLVIIKDLFIFYIPIIALLSFSFLAVIASVWLYRKGIFVKDFHLTPCFYPSCIPSKKTNRTVNTGSIKKILDLVNEMSA